MDKQFHHKSNSPSIKLFVGQTQATLGNIDNIIRIESDHQFQKSGKIQYLREKIIELQKTLEQSTKQSQLLKTNNQVLTKNLKQANSDVEQLFFRREECVLKGINSQRTRRSQQVQQKMVNEQFSGTDQQLQREKNNAQEEQKLESNRVFTANNLTPNRYLSLNGDSLDIRTHDSPQRSEQPFHRKSRSPEFRNILLNFDNEKCNRNKANRGSCDNAGNRYKAKISHPFQTPNSQIAGAQAISNYSELYRCESLSYLSQNHSTSIMNQGGKNPRNIQRQYENDKNFNRKIQNNIQRQEAKIKNNKSNGDLNYAEFNPINNQYQGFKANYQPVQPSFPRRQVISKEKQQNRNLKNISRGYKKGNYFKAQNSGEASKRAIKKMSINQLWQNSCVQPQPEQPSKRTSRKNQLNYCQMNGLITPQQNIKFVFVRRQRYQPKFDQREIRRIKKQPYLDSFNQQMSFNHERTDHQLQFQNRA